MSSEFDSLKGKTIYINGIPYEVESIQESSPSDPVFLGMKGKEGGGSFNSGSIPRESLRQAAKQPVPSLDLPSEPKETKSPNTIQPSNTTVPDVGNTTDTSKANQFSPTKDAPPSQTATQPTPNIQTPANDTSPQPQTDQSSVPNKPQSSPTTGSPSQTEAPTIQNPIGPSVPNQQPQPSQTSTPPTPLHNQPAPQINNFPNWKKLLNANNGNQAPSENNGEKGLPGKAKKKFNPLQGKKNTGTKQKAVNTGKKVAKKSLQTGEKIGKEVGKDIVKVVAEETLLFTAEIWVPIAIISVIVMFIIFFIVGSLGGGGSGNNGPTIEQQKEIESSMLKGGMTQEQINSLKKEFKTTIQNQYPTQAEPTTPDENPFYNGLPSDPQ